ncbi:PAS domain S-box protein [Desulfolutivibrio sp.]|uniref:PAS domain S-box protein n=1 Tax=Desulfolutivibrio sp. TaxID=2773296 RepID=UPI002F96D056
MTREQLFAERRRLLSELEEARRTIQELRTTPPPPEPWQSPPEQRKKSRRHLPEPPEAPGRIPDAANGAFTEAGSILAAAFDGFLVSDMCGRIERVNNALADMLGFGIPELIGKAIWDIEVTASRSDVIRRIARRETEGGRRFETVLQRKDGGFVDAEVSAFHLDHDGGRLVAFLRDVTERKRMERTLKLTQASMDTAALGIFWIAPEGRLLYVNDITCQRLEYSRDELLTMNISEVDPVFPMGSRRNHFKPYRNTQTLRFETIHRSRSGRDIPVLVTSNYLEFEDQEYEIAFAEDISELKRSQQDMARGRAALEENQARLSLAMDLTGMAPWEMDLATNTFTFDDRFYALYGTTSAREGGPFMPAQTYARKFVHPEDVWMVADEIRKTLAADAPGYEGQVEHRIVRRDGEIRHIVVRFRLIRDEAGRPVKTIGANQDITERKRIEEALATNEQRFRNLLGDMEMVAVQGYDQDRRVIYWNRASQRLYGYAETEALGRRLEDLIIPGPMREAVIHSIRDWLDKGASIPAGELYLLRKDGALVQVYSSHVMQETASGQKEMYCIDVDLTEIKKAHDQLLQAKESAEAASKAKSEFLANMSHEVRTPLNGIMGMLQILKDTTLDDEQAQFINLAMDSSKRLTRLLSDILDLSRVEAGKMQMQVEVIDLDGVVKQLAALHEPVSLQTGVRFQCTTHPGLPKAVLGDGIRLQQVLTNLVGNAFKFTTSGSVALEARPLPPRRAGEAQVLFTVADTGCGMDDSLLTKLFEPFVQASQGFTRRYQGAGLGLSIVKRIVELMGGNITVESAPGAGTTFFIAIPFRLASPCTADGRPTRLAGGAPAPRALRILIAEDDMVSLLAVSRQLEKKGHRIHAAHDGEEAVDALRKMDFDLVLMDVQMPTLDGVAATRLIRDAGASAAKADIPIIAMTAFAMAGDRERFLAAGMNDYVAKPVDAADVEAAIARVMEQVGRGDCRR